MCIVPDSLRASVQTAMAKSEIHHRLRATDRILKGV